MNTQKNTAMLIPRWQILLILVGFPTLYMLNSFTPWTKGLWGLHERAYYIPYWSSVLTLHWSSALLIIFFSGKSGITLADFGLRLSTRKAIIILGLLIAMGVGLVVFREFVLYSTGNLERELLQEFYPTKFSERLFFVFIALSAGFCEELVYRGFGITVLQAQGLRLWQAVILATLAFVFMHGLGGVYGFPFIFLAGLLLAGIYLWRKNLLLVMIIHAIFNLTAILAP